MSEATPPTPTAAQTPGPTGLPGGYARHRLPPDDRPPVDGAVRVSFYGTSTLLFDDGRTQLLVDAFITRPGREVLLRSLQTGERLIGTDPDAVEEWLARPEVGEIAAIFPAHSHHDHAIDVAYVARRTGAQVHGSESTLNIARGGGVPEKQMSLFVLGRPVEVGRFRVTVLPGHHPANPAPLSDDRALTIDEPLAQPAAFSDFVEGGSFAFHIEHGPHSILVQVPGYVIGALDQVRADVVFLSVVPIGAASARHDETFYRQIIGTVRPRLVVPVHWDNFMLPRSEDLPLLAPDVTSKFDFLIGRLEEDGISFGIMQGNQSVLLFAS